MVDALPAPPPPAAPVNCRDVKVDFPGEAETNDPLPFREGPHGRGLSLYAPAPRIDNRFLV